MLFVKLWKSVTGLKKSFSVRQDELLFIIPSVLQNYAIEDVKRVEAYMNQFEEEEKEEFDVSYIPVAYFCVTKERHTSKS